MPKTRRYRRIRKRMRKPTQRKQVRQMAGENTRSTSIVESIANGVGSVARLAGVVAPIIAAINTERKYYDISTSSTPLGGLTGTIVLTRLFEPTQGTGDSNLIGNSALMQDLQMRFAISKAVNNTLAIPILGSQMRILIFLWKGNQLQDTPTATKIFEAPSNFYSPLNKDYSDQIIVIKDKFMAVNVNATYSKADVTTTYTGAFQHLKVYKKLGVHARFDDNAAPTVNQPYILIAATATDGVNVTWYSRINYTDN